MNCACMHEAQDKIYGKGQRLCNEAGKDGNKYRCTVCGKVSDIKVVKSKNV